MRGAHNNSEKKERVVGIIPAYAGSTDLERMRKIPGQDHPRVCGEHCDVDSVSLDCEGSSPRMRGARLCIHLIDGSKRIIPAYAGSTRIIWGFIGA